MKHKYLVVYLLLTLISITDFLFFLNEEMFFRFKYDLSKTEEIHKLGELDIYNIQYNSIKFNSNDSLNLIPKHSYSLLFKESNREYIFTFNSEKREDARLLEGVVWFFKKPVEKKGEAIIKEVKLHRQETGSKTVIMMT